MSRRMEFKMERQGLLSIGDILPVTEGRLPNSYYYTLGPSYAMSENYPTVKRLHFEEGKAKEGKVTDIRETEKGFFVEVEFDDEPEVD